MQQHKHSSIKKNANNYYPVECVLLCDPGAIQTHDLQNRNLTLYSLSYGAKTVVQKYKKYKHVPNDPTLFYFDTNDKSRPKYTIKASSHPASIVQRL